MHESDLARLAHDAKRVRARHLRDLIAEPNRSARYAQRVGPLISPYVR